MRRLTSTVCWGRFLLLQPQTSLVVVPRTRSLVRQPVQRLPLCIRAGRSLSNLPFSVEELGRLFRELAEGVVRVVRAVHVGVLDESIEHGVERRNDCSSVRGVGKGRERRGALEPEVWYLKRSVGATIIVGVCFLRRV